jgi:hypothetical protein
VKNTVFEFDPKRHVQEPPRKFDSKFYLIGDDGVVRVFGVKGKVLWFLAELALLFAVGCSGPDFASEPDDAMPASEPRLIITTDAGEVDAGAVLDAAQSQTECQKLGVPYTTDPYTGITCTSAGPGLCTCTPRK